ncbi:MAG: 23S rRNA (guanosine(2251)-2'-O)-methyltransferase RlmB [Burkholderiales bacterium]|nr:MAG: 23S rRNA (guanosine(2251)-2'-O)-methyltransferase RlmB [Burkholderiales bacterium]
MARLRRAPEGIREVYIDSTRDDARVREVVKVANAAGLRPHFVDGSRIAKMCPGKRHQGVVAIVDFAPPTLSLDDLLESASAPITLLLLDGVTDPRNLGACLRVADGAGAAAVIAPKDHACALTEAAVQTASGAAESVPYVMVTNLARAMDAIRERDIWLIGTDDAVATSLYDETLPASVAWVLGAEGTGMRRLTRERCDSLVRIPMAGQVGSLNVSVAAGVVLYETVRQRLCRGEGVRGAVAAARPR